VAPIDECHAMTRPITLGTTKLGFARTLSALSMPSSADPLDELVEQDLTFLFENVE
jgi:hypothetical protein